MCSSHLKKIRLVGLGDGEGKGATLDSKPLSCLALTEAFFLKFLTRARGLRENAVTSTCSTNRLFSNLQPNQQDIRLLVKMPLVFGSPRVTWLQVKVKFYSSRNYPISLTSQTRLGSRQSDL